MLGVFDHNFGKKKPLQMGDTETAWHFFHRFFVERLKPNHYSQRGKPSRILRHGEPAPRTVESSVGC